MSEIEEVDGIDEIDQDEELDDKVDVDKRDEFVDENIEELVDEKGKLNRATRIPAEMINFNGIPVPTEQTKMLADMVCSFREPSVEFGTVLYNMREHETPRLQLSRIPLWLKMQKYTIIEGEMWYSLSYIGSSKLVVSSKGRTYNITERRLYVTERIFVTLDNGKQINVFINNLVNSAFWKFPTSPNMTSDHIDQNRNNNDYLNLAYESKRTQVLNRTLGPIRSVRPVVILAPDKTTVFGRWASAREAGDATGLNKDSIIAACISHWKYNGTYWRFDDYTVMEGEIFKFTTEVLPSNKEIFTDGEYDILEPEKYKISNFGRTMNMTTGRIKDFCPNFQGRAVLSFKKENTKTGYKRFYAYVFVALLFVENANPLIYKIVHHIDSVPSNSVYTNLMWTNQSGNVSYAYQNDHKNSSPVIHKNADGTVLRKYINIAEASRVTNIPYSTIQKERAIKTEGYVGTYFERVKEDADRIYSGGIPVAQLDALTKKVLFIWASAAEADKYTGVDVEGIYKTVAGKTHSAYGFGWRYLTEDEAPYDLSDITNINILKSKTIKSPKILEINMDGTIKHSFDTIAKAEKFLKPEDNSLNKFTIIGICKGWKRSQRFFLYENEYNRRREMGETITQFVITEIDYNKTPVVVMSLEGNFIDVYKYIKIIPFITINNRNTVVHACLGLRETFKNHRFEFKFLYDKNVKSNPDYYKNLPSAVLKAIKKRDNQAQSGGSGDGGEDGEDGEDGEEEEEEANSNGAFTRKQLNSISRDKLRIILRKYDTKVDFLKADLITKILAAGILRKDHTDMYP